MKMPEPVAWWNGKETAWFEHELDGYKPPPDATIPLFTEAQLREALAGNEAVMRVALEALKQMMSIVAIHSRATKNNFAWAEMDEARAAIKALEEQLK